jgi:hypothetical protein
MENLINELCRTFFQQLPNGLCLIFAIGVVVSLVFILPKRKHHNPLYAAFWVGILLMVVWRLIVGLVAVRYVNADGTPATEFPANPNGSLNSIAGICDPTGRIFGLMPHPEAFLSPFNSPTWTQDKADGKLAAEGEGVVFFRNAVDYIAENF